MNTIAPPSRLKGASTRGKRPYGGCTAAAGDQPNRAENSGALVEVSSSREAASAGGRRGRSPAIPEPVASSRMAGASAGPSRNEAPEWVERPWFHGLPSGTLKKLEEDR